MTSSDECSTAPPIMSPLWKGQEKIMPIYKFVLTGGPCAGKTTGMARLATYFGDRGFRVYVVPEAATLLQTAGASFVEIHQYEHLLNFQWRLLSTQMHLEDCMESLAQDSGKPCILLCDRGSMDGSAYIEPQVWEDLKERHNLDTVNLRDTRYNAVFHLITAADGAESYYTNENNKTRYESIEGAKLQDIKTRIAWVGHPKLYVIDNSTDFEGKIQSLVNTAARLVGIPSTIKSSRKFRVVPPKMEHIPVRCEVFEVEKVYLKLEDSSSDKDAVSKRDYSFVRCRSQHGLASYGMTTVRVLENGESVDVKRILNSREYAYAVRNCADPTRHVIKQQRLCFLWQNQSFQIHIFKEPQEVSGLAILHAQASTSDECNLQIPSFIQILSDVPDDVSDLSAYQISKKEKANVL